VAGPASGAHGRQIQRTRRAAENGWAGDQSMTGGSNARKKKMKLLNPQSEVNSSRVAECTRLTLRVRNSGVARGLPEESKNTMNTRGFRVVWAAGA